MTEEDDDIQDYKKPWVGLTNEEQLQLHEEWYRSMDGWGALFNSIETKLKEKNT